MRSPALSQTRHTTHDIYSIANRPGRQLFSSRGHSKRSKVSCCHFLYNGLGKKFTGHHATVLFLEWRIMLKLDTANLPPKPMRHAVSIAEGNYFYISCRFSSDENKATWMHYAHCGASLRDELSLFMYKNVSILSMLWFMASERTFNFANCHGSPS
jgi:hypothetical protein